MLLSSGLVKPAIVVEGRPAALCAGEGILDAARNVVALARCKDRILEHGGSIAKTTTGAWITQRHTINSGRRMMNMERLTVGYITCSEFNDRS